MTSNIDMLTNTFGLDGKINFTENKGLVKLTAQTKFSKLECYLHGAHITSFVINNAEDLLWLSPMAIFEKGKAIRGGIPLCWPWFGKHPSGSSLQQHGFARNNIFDVKATKELENGDLQIVLALTANEATMKVWPYHFSLELHIMAGMSLSIELVTHNLDSKVFSVTEAIHSYFNVRDVSNVRLNGLQGSIYYDQLVDNDFVQTELNCQFTRETDRIYQAPDNDILLLQDNAPKIRIQQEHGNAVVVWNPWIEKAKLMGDFPDNGFKNMLCLEAANVRYSSIELAPGASRSLKQTISLHV
jgi:glucose-6-phosphate 1-epimerase